MKVLGLGTGGDSGAAIVEDGRLVAAVNEERLSRLKLVVGFPRASIREVLALSGTDASELDAVLVGATAEKFVDALEPFDGWFRTNGNGNGNGASPLKKAASKLSRYRDRLPFLETGYYALQAPGHLRRRAKTRQILAEEFGIDWTYLASIHLVETRMGRIRGTSVAGAQGPMQFIPATWASYGPFRGQHSPAILDDGTVLGAEAEYGAMDRIRRTVAALPAKDPYGEWARWFLSDDPNRSIAPGFKVTPQDWGKWNVNERPKWFDLGYPDYSASAVWRERGGTLGAIAAKVRASGLFQIRHDYST